MKKDFLGPVFCAALYSRGEDYGIFKDSKPTIQLALRHVFGEQAKKFQIGFIDSEDDAGAVSAHLEEIKASIAKKISSEFDFKITDPLNKEYFYVTQTNLPKGYYVTGLTPDDRETILKIFAEHVHIIKAFEMEVLGFSTTSSSPTAAEALSKLEDLSKRIVVTATDGSVFVVADINKLERLKGKIPAPLPISQAQALAIITRSEENDSKPFDETTHSESTPELSQRLSTALKKLGIHCSTGASNQTTVRIAALPFEYEKIAKIWEQHLQEFTPEMCKYFHIQVGTQSSESKIDQESVRRWLGNSEFRLLPGPAIYTTHSENLTAIKGLRGEWFDISNDYFNLLTILQPQTSLDTAAITRYLKTNQLIPENLSVPVTKFDRHFRISIPHQCVQPIHDHFHKVIIERTVVVDDNIRKILQQKAKSTGPLSTALQKLSEEKSIGHYFISYTSSPPRIIFNDKADVDKLTRLWVRQRATVSPQAKIAVKLGAAQAEYPDTGFKGCLDHLKISAQIHSTRILPGEDDSPTIDIDLESLEILNQIIGNYVLIPPKVASFIQPYLGKQTNICKPIGQSGQLLIEKQKLIEAYSKLVPAAFISTVSGKVMTSPQIFGDNEVCDADEKINPSSTVYRYDSLGKTIGLWKQQSHFEPMSFDPIPSVAHQNSSSSAASSSSVVNSVSFIKNPPSSSSSSSSNSSSSSSSTPAALLQLR